MEEFMKKLTDVQREINQPNASDYFCLAGQEMADGIQSGIKPLSMFERFVFRLRLWYMRYLG